MFVLISESVTLFFHLYLSDNYVTWLFYGLFSGPKYKTEDNSIMSIVNPIEKYIIHVHVLICTI